MKKLLISVLMVLGTFSMASAELGIKVGVSAELGELSGAAKMFEIATSLSPNYAEAHFNLGVIYQDLVLKASGEMK